MLRYARARSASWAALFCIVTATGVTLAPRVARADEEVSDEARKHFKAGVAFLQDPDGERPEEAYAEFKLAYSLSRSPKVLGNLALCAMKLERDGEAIEAYTRYALQVSDIDEDERRQVNSDIAMLTASAVRLTLAVDAPDVRIIDTRIPVRGMPITNVYGPVNGKLEILIRPGHHRFQAKAAGVDAQWELDAASGARTSHDFHLAASPPPPAPPPDADRPPRTSKVGPIVTMGIGGALLATAAVTGVVALRKIDDLERTCPRNECPAGVDYTGARNSAQTFVGVTDVLLLSGALATVGGVAWFFLQGDSTKASSPAPGATTTASCTREGCGATFRFDFQ